MSELQIYPRDSTMPPLTREDLVDELRNIISDGVFLNEHSEVTTELIIETLHELKVLRTEP